MARIMARQQGFTLIEVLLCVVIVAIVFPAAVRGFAFSYTEMNEARMLEVARSIAQFKMEEQLAAPMPFPIDPPESFPGMPGYRYSAVIRNETTGLTCITVMVTYSYLGEVREHKVVAWRGN